MEREEWDACSFLLENGWGGKWDDSRDDAYFTLLRGLDAADVLAAIQVLVEEGREYLPAAAEIASRARSLSSPPMPSWAEAWEQIEAALIKGCDEDQAVERLNSIHPLLGPFVRVAGWKTLQTTEFYDHEYGAVRVRDLEARWNEFVERAEERVRQGRALEAAGRPNGLPTRLDATAVLGGIAKRRELEAGA